MVSGLTITADNILTGYTLDLNGKKIRKDGWDLYEYNFSNSSGSLGNTVFGVDFIVKGTKGIEWQNDITFSLKKNSTKSYANFFVNFNSSDPFNNIKDYYYYGTISYPNFEIIRENYPIYSGLTSGTVLRSKKLRVCENMLLKFENFKSVEFVPTVVAFNNDTPIISESCWEDGAFTYKVPYGVNYVVIQCKNNMKYAAISSEMPEVLLVGAYKNSDSLRAKVLTTNKKYEIGSIVSGMTTDIIYQKNYVIECSVNLVRATVKHNGGSITLVKNTKNKAGLVTYDKKDQSYLPNAAGTVESVSYTILSNKIKRLEHLVSNKPTWLIDTIPNTEHFGSVPLTRSINGYKLDKDIELTIGEGSNETISDLLKVDDNLLQVLDCNNFFIKDKLIFNSNTITEESGKIEVDSGNSNYFEWDISVSALSFNGGFYTVSSLSSLDSIIVNNRLYFAKDQKVPNSGITTYIECKDGDLSLFGLSGKSFTINVDTIENGKLYFDSGKTAYFQWDKDKKSLFYSGTLYANEVVSVNIPSSAFTDNKLLYNNARINGSAITSSTTISIVNSALTSYSANTITSGTISGNLNVQGNITATGEITAYSDARLKKVIDTLTFRGRLSPIIFNWQSGDTETHVGFIAQDVENIYPELVHTDKNGLLSLNYGAITAVLASQINEIEDNVVKMSEKIKSLENKIM